MLLRDRQDCVPLRNILAEDDIIVLLTPVVVPYNRHAENDRDPFEPLGRAIASRHALIRHVPYTKRGGINKIHSEFIRRAKAVVFVVSGPPVDGDVSQLEMAETARTLANERPQILVACCELQAQDIPDEKFPTIVQIAGYTPSELETAASIMFGEYRPQPINAVPVQNLVIAPRHWPVEGNMGWYDQYARLDGTPHIEDVIIGLEGETIVAIALTYIPNSGSPIDEDLPWAKTIGMDVGGVTCICITDDNREMVNSRDSVMIRLLDTCVKMLAERGMRQMFIDAVKGGNAGFQSLGKDKRWLPSATD
ncbi:acetyltransferase [Colletotrichum karsti]|uniref:Acetyltransferase n=1 Tax=Colletotrichum karsti TaxID=1095194 RepID=A0A9P6I1R7_9PEZI|nr:acetyltransferase [Colletotrichum karsti]KAF9874863.1 acetyltransferase [Colletotrichum karsti]